MKFKMGKFDGFKIIGLVGMAVCAVGTLLSNWASDKEMEAIIDEKIEEKLAADEDEES